MTKSIMKPVRIPPDLLERAEDYMAAYGFDTWSDFVRTAIAEFCDSLQYARLGWQPPEVSDDGSRVRIRWDDQEESEPEFYDAIIHWVNGEAVLKPPLTRAATYDNPDAVKPCDK